MAIGPGKYDELAEYVLLQAKAQAVVVIVTGGDRGSGMSRKSIVNDVWDLAAELEALSRLPRLLRHIADTIEQDLQSGQL
jgi:hypothetical protein